MVDVIQLRLRTQGATIPKGTVVTTGTLTAPVDVSEEGSYVARVGGASVAFTLASLSQ